MELQVSPRSESFGVTTRKSRKTDPENPKPKGSISKLGESLQKGQVCQISLEVVIEEPCSLAELHSAFTGGRWSMDVTGDGRVIELTSFRVL